MTGQWQEPVQWSELYRPLWKNRDKDRDEAVAILEQRDRELAQWLNAQVRGTFALAASFPGPLREVTSPPLPIHVPATLIRVDCNLGTAGSSSTIVKWYRNGGTALDSITLASSDDDEYDDGYTDTFDAYTDLLTVEIDTAGTAAEDLSVLFTFEYGQ